MLGLLVALGLFRVLFPLGLFGVCPRTPVPAAHSVEARRGGSVTPTTALRTSVAAVTWVQICFKMVGKQ